MNYLEQVNCSADIKKLDYSELEQYCRELRSFILQTVSKTGGHLAASLGTVELTVALHRVYETESDRIVFDVGHQAYAHKIITGRRDQFHTLRTNNGLSGFTKPYEADDDAFVSGHASNSVSVALGMARARTSLKKSYEVAAVIGDGALTGGLSYEGLCDAATSGEPIVVVVNDNTMSINPNVGGLANSLQQMRMQKNYIEFKRKYRDALHKAPELYSFSHNVKEKIKDHLLPSNYFSDMGFEYIGPIDGHNLKQMERSFAWAKDLQKPVIVHVITKKGMGYSFAENNPQYYHGIGPFDISSGKQLQEDTICYSDVFGEIMEDIASKDDRISVITAAMANGTGLSKFSKRFPNRFFDVGIAEEHAVSLAAGMAKQGLVPVFAVYSSFLQRAYDMLIHDVALLGLHVVFAVDRAGIVGSDGETHNGVFDISFLSTIPGITILAPADYSELRVMLHYAIYEINGPVAIRYPRGGEDDYKECFPESETILRDGEDITLVCYGKMTSTCIAAADLLREMGIRAEIIKLGVVHPNSFSLAAASYEKTGRIFFAEDVCESNCIASQMVMQFIKKGISCEHIMVKNLGNGIVSQGTQAEKMKEFGLDSDTIMNDIRDFCVKTGLQVNDGEN